MRLIIYVTCVLKENEFYLSLVIDFSKNRFVMWC